MIHGAGPIRTIPFIFRSTSGAATSNNCMKQRSETNCPHAGILIANRRSSDFELARQIMTALDTFTAEEVVNQLFYV